MAGQDTYDPGQCTWYVAGALAWVRGGWGNAGDWAANAQAQGFQLTLIPTVGAVVVYAAGDGYSLFGHCGIVESVDGQGLFTVAEMNFVAAFEVDHRQSNLYDVAAFILPPGVQPGQPPAGPLGQGAGSLPQGLGPVNDAWSFLQSYYNDHAPQQDQVLTAVLAALPGVG